jgi:diguanylate cyclase (GGDEF)-like protein
MADEEVNIMRDYIWFIYALMVIFVFLPFFRIDLYFKYKKYHKFFYINIVLLLWTLILGLRFVVSSSFFTYYASLSIYPLVFGLVILLVLAVHDYLVINVKKWFKITLLILWIINAVTVLSNSTHQFIIKLSFRQDVTLSMFNSASVGFGFFIHTFLSYSLLAYVFYRLTYYFHQEFRKNRDFVPLVIITISFVAGLFVNLIHLFVYEFTLDPTLVICIMFMGSLYIIFVIRDLNLISQLNNNQFILDHYREMYLIVDINGMVVNASDELITKFELKDLNHISYEEITALMHEKAVIYQDSKSVNHTYQKDKIYLHMKEEKINLPLFKYSGKLFLYYDETEHQELMHELNYVLYHDMMTDLYNRNYFEEYKKQLNQSENSFEVIIFDLDGLKRTNDHFGHDVGDQMLVCFANSLKEVSEKYRKTTAIRLGGDEFVLIIEEEVNDYVDDIINHMNNKMSQQNHDICTGFSYGAAIRKDQKQDVSEVLKIADKALYDMKKQKHI